MREGDRRGASSGKSQTGLEPAAEARARARAFLKDELARLTSELKANRLIRRNIHQDLREVRRMLEDEA